MPGENFVKNCSQTIDIGMTIDEVQVSGRLLWCHVGGCANRLPLDGETHVARTNAINHDRIVKFSLSSADQLGESPVENHDFAEFSQHDVLALEITVDH